LKRLSLLKVSTEQSCYKRLYLEDPVEGSFLVEDLEAAVTGEGEQSCYQRLYLEDPVEGSLLVEDLDSAITGEGEH
jgi:hypothetical protein